MAEIHAAIPLSALSIPDDLTIPQFFFDSTHERRPSRSKTTPWIVEDETGKGVFEDELRQRVHGLANALKIKYDIGENDCVLLFSRNHIDYAVAIWATHRLGGVISGANPEFMPNELLYQVQEAKAKVLIVHPESLSYALQAASQAGLPTDRIVLFDVRGKVTEKMRETHETVDSLVAFGLGNKVAYIEKKLKKGEARTKRAFLSFSSGTTGKPKAVDIPHYALIANVIQCAVHNRVNEQYAPLEDQRFRPGDVTLGVLPFYRRSRLFDLVPPQVVALVKNKAIVERYNPKAIVRMVFCGAAPLTHELTHELYEMFPDAHVGQAWGMTEICTAGTMWSIDRKRGLPGSAGVLVPGTIARVVKPDGSLAGYNEEGELVIKCPSVATGYANNEKATKETFIDGWVRTGDEVKITRGGEVKVLDRLKEIMKVKGFQVAPAELEGCLLDHKDVLSACIVGIPDDYSGEVPLAFVVLRPGSAKRATDSPSEAQKIKQSIIKHVADNKVSYKHLAGGVEFILSIPVSPSGKILRRVLRDQARGLKKSKAKL